MYDPYFTLKILRSSPRRHRGERTTTIPMKTPPLPVSLAVAGCFILCRFPESVHSIHSKIIYRQNNKPICGHLFEKERLQMGFILLYPAQFLSDAASKTGLPPEAAGFVVAVAAAAARNRERDCLISL